MAHSLCRAVSNQTTGKALWQHDQKKIEGDYVQIYEDDWKWPEPGEYRWRDPGPGPLDRILAAGSLELLAARLGTKWCGLVSRLDAISARVGRGKA